MTAPDLPAELKAALDARLQGLSRNDAAGRAAADLADLSRRRRLRRDQVGDRCAGLCAGADARDLCRCDRKPERARRDHAGFRARKACSMSAPGRERRPGPRPKHFHRCKVLRCWMPTPPCARWRWISASDSTRLRDMTYQRGEARAALADAEPADLVVASYMIGEIDDARTKNARRTDVGEDPRHAADRRARHAGGLRADHRAARAADRIGRACRSALPA